MASSLEKFLWNTTHTFNMGKKITLHGKVHNVGYRLFLLEQADTLFIPYFDARNIKLDGKETLIILVDGEDARLNEFIDFVNSNFPEKAVVESITVSEYTEKIKDIDKFRQSFDTIQLSKLVQGGLVLLEYTKYIPEIRDNTKYIPEIRDNTKYIPEIRDNTKYIPEIRNDIKDIKMNLQEVRDDTKEIKMNSYETNHLLEEKFIKIETEIQTIKMALFKAGIKV